ncbi:hypothetical protein AK830_g11755 [Neonectria ditissima]|uniref:Uncharacterized protein n=1 Tax=Neonectria ditissima TaxID=78410 RepID=A0A0P7B1Y4_9HYPO|nr:hypothetical protein AK830_g11755 [Neonectria ditissima]
MVPSTLLLALGVAVSGVRGFPTDKPIKPNRESSKENANRIFNAIHSAGRQWGSSLYHNGFGFFPAVMPMGTLLFHGDWNNTVPVGPEWLAFEIEHAEGFAHSHKKGARRPPGAPGDRRPDEPSHPPLDGHSNSQDPLSRGEESRQELRRRDGHSPDDHGDEDKNVRGYLHTYQAKRDLNLLYIDGMSAGKTSMGTLDSQDLLLRENTTNHDRPGFDEFPRALDLCDLASEWGFDGLVRTEAGFEVIYCDFTNGLNVISMTRTMMPDDKIGDDYLGQFQWARAVAERYDGLGADRLRIDFSSMVSGLFFPINITSSDIDRPDLVRLESAGLPALKDIKRYLADVATQPRRFTVNWQGVVDLIVGRFAKRMGSMASDSLSWRNFVDEIESITSTWFDAAPLPDDITLTIEDEEVNRTADAIFQCRKHFLRPATINWEKWSFEDELIFTSIDTVMENVCSTLFSVRDLLYDASPRGDTGDESRLRKAAKTGRALVRGLMEELAWTVWAQEQPCPPGEVLFIAMWPFGGAKDHWNPGCRSIDGLMPPGEEPYWMPYWNMGSGSPKGKPRAGDKP